MNIKGSNINPSATSGAFMPHLMKPSPYGVLLIVAANPDLRPFLLRSATHSIEKMVLGEPMVVHKPMP